MPTTSSQEDFAQTEQLLAQITERLHAVCATDDAVTLDTLQRLLVVYDLCKEVLIADALADAGNLYPFYGVPPAHLAFESVRTAAAAVQDRAKIYAQAAPDVDTLLSKFFQDFTRDFGPDEK